MAGLPARASLLLMLVVPLCAAACGMHADAPEALAAEGLAVHADCHGMASTDAVGDAGVADMDGANADRADEAADDCCEDHDAALAPEPAPSLPDPVLAFTGLSLEHLIGRASAPVAPAPPEPGGRSPGRLLLLLVLAFLE